MDGKKERRKGLFRSGRLSRGAVLGGLITVVLVLLGIFGPSIAPYDPTDVSLKERLIPPTLGNDESPAHLFGTDQLGRDILSRVLHAARVTVSISLIAVFLSALVGVILGLVSGFYGGVTDNVLMRIADVQLSFPTILLAITMVAVLGTGVSILIFVFVVAGWVRYVRVIRAQVLVLKEMDYVQAARATGARNQRIMVRHLLPNVLTEIIILMSLELGRIILLESSLSYLGLGVQPPLPTWGNMLSEGRLYVTSSWWVVTIPGLMIVLAVLGVNLLGEGVRTLYDPRSRR
jgi:peptide/nickel transport system permease protein